MKLPSITGGLHILCGTTALFLLPYAALVINLGLARKSPAWSTRRLPLLATAGLPLMGFLGFVIYTALFAVPLGPAARGPGVNIGWPPHVAFISYMLWLVVLASQALRIQGPEVMTERASEPVGDHRGPLGSVRGE